MKIFIKSINVFLAILLIASALSVAMLAFPVFGNKALIVRSGSMEPTISVGSLIIVSANQRLVPGDIIAFHSEKNYDTIITHRISTIQQAGDRVYLKTKGDANKTIDGWEVSPKNIIGKNFVIIPEIGKLLSFARTKVGFPLLVITPAIFVILLEFLSIISEIRKKARKKMLIHPLNLDASPPSPNFNAAKVLGPFIILAFVAQSTFAFFSDTEKSTGNFFAAASSFGTPTPTPSVSPTPTPTSTPTPTPCSGGCCGSNNNNVVIVGNGAGSNTEVEIDNECNSNVNQNNSTTVNTNVNQSSNTGGNNNSGNTSNSTTTTGSSSTSTTVTTTSSSNTNH